MLISNTFEKILTDFFIFLIFRRILKCEPPIPEDIGLSSAVKDFIRQLLIKDSRQRLGGGPTDAQELKSHKFFKVCY